VTERQIAELLRRTPVPAEREAEERGWRVVLAAFEDRLPARRPARRSNRMAIAIAIALLGLVLALTPAGAKVADLVHDVVHPGTEHARPLTSLPAPGRLLVNSPQGPWVVNEDGSKRLLGDYRDATWSPHGYFVAVTRGHQLTAVEPGGNVHWSLTKAGHVGDPRWAPSGYRIAYQAGRSMRVVAGDGTGDHLLARGVASTPPAWRPVPFPEAKVSATGAGANVLALATTDGQIVLVDADSRRVMWRSAPGPVPSELDWSANGSRLVALSGSSLRLFAPRGELLRTQELPSRIGTSTGEFAPSGGTFAIAGTSRAHGRTRSQALLLNLGSGRASRRRLLSDPGRFTALSWSPNGRWLLVSWRDTDQWLFLNPATRRRIKTVGGISRQFNPGATGPAAFPRLAGWCCTR
jgi:WD40 repeat protein